MAECLMGSHAETGVQEEYALPCPSSQISTLRQRRACLHLYLLEDISQRRWKGHPIVHREAKAVRLARSMIRVLTKDDHSYLFERSLVERIEDKGARRIADTGGVFLPHESYELGEVGFLELTL